MWSSRAPTLEETCILLAAVLLRACLALHGYSGEGQAPMFGDFEAQRHWMEVTTSLPPREWYVNSTDNDLLYWGLDYPPLSAYLSWIIGCVSSVMHPELVALHTSRGHEAEDTRVFMRRTVLLCDMFVFLPAALLAVRVGVPPGFQRMRALAMLCFLPPLVLIDHGHFQYNCVSLGLVLWGALAAMRGWPLCCCIAFSLSLNLKQMGLYLAPAFFCYLLAGCLRRPQARSRAVAFVKLGSVTILVFAACWAPFLPLPEHWMPVLGRIFPTSRHLYEDKVANVWCTVALLPGFKLKALLPISALLKLSTGCTLLALLPPCYLLLRRPSRLAFLLAATSSSLAFFLFSFQVHEKHILLPLIPAALLGPRQPQAFTWFATVASFSLFPLLARDHLRLAYMVAQAGYLALGLSFPQGEQPGVLPLPRPLRVLMHLSLLGMGALHVAEMVLLPPARYPDLHSVTFAAYACVHFVFAYTAAIVLLCQCSALEAVHTPFDGDTTSAAGAHPFFLASQHRAAQRRKAD